MPMNKRQRSILTVLWALVVIGAVTVLAMWAARPDRASRQVSVATPGDDAIVRIHDESPDDGAPGFVVPPFTFTNQLGQTITLDDLKGQPWVAAFVFTRCAGPCPIMTATMSTLQDDLPAGARLVSFTLDPDYDTPEVLTAYAEQNKADNSKWHFLTGTLGELKKMTSAMRIGVENGQEPEDIIHSEHFVLIAPDATVAGYYNPNDPGRLDTLKQDLRRLSPASTN